MFSLLRFARQAGVSTLRNRPQLLPVWARSFSEGSGHDGNGSGSSKNKMTETEFMKLTEDYLQNLAEEYEKTGDDFLHDVDYHEGAFVITTHPKRDTFMLNRQTPNRQIWYSSPVRYIYSLQ